MRVVTVRYFDLKLLRSIDMNFLLELLASQVRDVSRVEIDQMAEEGKAAAARTDRNGVVMVRERIHIFVSGEASRERRQDLEAEIERNSP